MRSQTIEIMEDALMCRGLMDGGGILKPTSANAFVVREGDTVFVIDTGAGKRMKKALLEAVKRLRKDTEKLVLINTRCNIDRICNNDAVMALEGFIKKRHFMHESGKMRLDQHTFHINLLLEFDRFYNVLEGPPPPWRFFTRLLAIGSRDKHVRRMVESAIKKYEPGGGSAETIQFLKESDIIPIEVGSSLVDDLSIAGEVVSINLEPLTVRGWKTDNVVIMADGSSSEDQVLVYFPEKKLMILGDLPYEMFPLHLHYSCANKVIDKLETVQEFARDELVTTVVDSHHQDVYNGQEKIRSFLQKIINSHNQFREALLSCFEEGRGETIKSLYRILRKKRYENPAVDYHLENQFPKAPVFLKSLICSLLLDLGYRVEGRGNKATFYRP